MMDLPKDCPKPRLCHLVKWPDFNGYGFNLHAEKSKMGQYIGKVDDDSPAYHAGLREGDRIIEVNGTNIANENHKQVVERIKSVPNETKLLVLDDAADKWYKERKLVVKSTQFNVIYRKTPSEQPKNAAPAETPEPATVTDSAPLTTMDKKSSHDKINNNNDYEMVKEEMNSDTCSEILNDIHTISSTALQSNGSKSDEQKSDGLPSIRSSGSQSDERSMTHSPSFKSVSSTDEGQNVSALNLNLSASEMKKLLAQRKKYDPKKVPMDLREKYEIIQQL